MSDNASNKDCGFGDEIVSYIYDELAVADRRKFETHLVSCTTCTDEFAAVSYSRFSVFEWQKNEFATLMTPEIVIPYTRNTVRQVKGTKAGFLTGFGEILGSWRVAFAAVALVLAGAGFLAVNYLRQPDQRVAANVETGSALPLVDTAANVTQDLINESPVDPEILPVGTRAEKTSTIHPAKVQDFRRAIRPRNPVKMQNSTNFATQPVTNQKMKNAPVLTNYEDNDDKSLRLADLFDTEIGMKR